MAGKGKGEHSAENGKNGGRPLGSKSAATLAKEAAEQAEFERLGLTAQRVLRELATLSFSNVQDLFDEAGNLKPITALTREQASAIASVEVIKKNAEAGDGKTDLVHKIRVVDKTKTIDMLAKYFQLYAERLDVNGTIRLVWDE